MKTSLLLAAMLTVATLGACDRRDAPDDQAAADTTAPGADSPDASAAADAATDPSADAMATTDPAAAGNGDPLALGLLGAVNEHEIAAARQAKEKKVSGAVLAYAEMMETEHGANQAKTQSLGTLADTDEVKAMKEKSQAELATLGEKSGEDYEAAYIDAMVNGHTEALSLIDTRLLTLASAGPVKQHLTETRDAVARHLQEAQELQADK